MAPKKHVILFLAANPSGTDRLSLDREAHSIRAELKRSGYRDRFEFETRWAVEPLDLLRELRELKPTVVHVSGHGGARMVGVAESAHARDVVAAPAPSGGEAAAGGLYFHDPAGGAQVVSPDAIAQTFGAAGSSVKLVVLNACFSEPIADALLAYVGCVVGMSGSIHDDAARSFAIGFYGGLGEHESIAVAFEHGRAAIKLDGLPDAERPRCKVRDGFDATQLILAAAAPSSRLAQPCPYPGMRPYSADDAAGFHGRDTEINEVLGRLRAGEREIYVIGPSGSGKSSLVAAGVLPRLARGVAGLGSFVIRELRPGEQPAARLCQALEVPAGQPIVAVDCIAALLAHRGPSSSVLIVVDQLEELFTLASADERAQFLGMLRTLRAERRCAVIFTLRADFFGALMESRLWAEHGGQLSRIEVSPLRGEALREAIAAPARDVDVVVEPALIERLIADAASEPGILPLLQETMVQLWEARSDQTLTLADYQALGDGERSGLAVALARRADATLRRLTPVQTQIAHRILLRLVSFGEGRSDTRRQQPRAKLRTAGDDEADLAYVLQTMIDHRLLTIYEEGGEPWVDLGHEIMITAWPTLAGWIRSHRVDEQRRRQLEAAAAQWVEHGRGARGLLDPFELADAEKWQLTESALALGQSAEVMALIAVSRAEQIKQVNEAREQANKVEASERRSRRLLAQSYAESGRQLLVAGRPQEAIPYLLEARRNGEDNASLRMMFWTAMRRLPLAPALEHPAEVASAVFSPDGTRVVTASWDKTARVWDAVTGKPVTAPLEHEGIVVSAAFSPDGTRVVTASEDGTARVWDAATGKPLTSALKHQRWVESAAFSPDGTRVVTASEDKTARVWDAATGKPVTRPLKHRAKVMSAAFSPDGTRVVTASKDRTARVWDAATGKPVTSPLKHQDTVVSAAFSPDGTRVVTASVDQTARVWDATTGKPLARPLKHRGLVVSAAFSPDGTRVVTASTDKTARVWDAATGKPLAHPLMHQDAVESAAFSPDDTRIVTASKDKTARVWNAATGKPLTSPLDHQDTVVNAAFSADGTRVVTASWDKTARVWDVATGKSLTSPLTHRDAVVSAAFSADGTRVVTASTDKTARVWDAAAGKPLTGPLKHQELVSSAAFSPDGTRVVTASWDRTARVWDATTGKPLTSPLAHPEKVVSAAFSPDGTRVVTASYDNNARIWDAATGKPVATFKHEATVESAAFSPDGTRVVTTSWDNTAWVWDAATSKLLTSLVEHQDTDMDDTMEHAAFSPDGTRVVTASEDKTACIWDAATGKPLTNPLEHRAKVVSAAFSPDGTRVVTASEDKTARIWDAATGKPLTSRLEHQAEVLDAAFSPDGTRVVTASEDKTARIWDVRLDEGTLEQWSAAAERSPFVLSGIAHTRRAPPPCQQPSSAVEGHQRTRTGPRRA